MKVVVVYVAVVIAVTVGGNISGSLIQQKYEVSR